MKAAVPKAYTKYNSMHVKCPEQANPYRPEVDCCCCCCEVASVVSDSVRPHRRQPTRLPCPWDSPGKNTGVGCHFLLECVKVKSLSRVRLCATPSTATHQAPLSLGFSRQEHWSGLPFPSPMRESEVTQSCPTLSDPMDCSPPGSSVHGIFQARVLDWGAIAYSGCRLVVA